MSFSFKYSSRSKIGVVGMAIAFTLTGLITPSHALEFPNTGGRGGPSSTAGGGVRGECGANINSEVLTALMPTNDQGEYEHTFVDDTVTLVFHISAELSEKMGEIYAEDMDTGEVIVEQEIALNQTPGSVSVTFPATLADGTPLTPNRSYGWAFSIICDPIDRGVDIYTTGLFTQVSNTASQPTNVESTEVTNVDNTIPEPTSVESTEAASVGNTPSQPTSVESTEVASVSIATARAYAQEQIWQESYQILDTIKCTHRSEWDEFLTSVGVDGGIIATTLSQCSQ
ncbi:MAG: DUF928 domain-containing protein [Leptolyngbyaceae cyanobacterium]